VIALPIELTHEQASACLQTMVQGLSSEAGPHVVVSGATLQRFDSSALAVLLELRRQCQSTGKEFAVTDLPKQLLDLAGLYGVDELLPSH
jgi:phospholipid transport system transporter-binding protein